jgi:Protein kinase domain
MVPGREDDGWRSATATTPFPHDTTQPTIGMGVEATAPAHRVEQRVGRYLLRALLGAGAMGEVWVATDPQLERDVAIKLVHPRLARYPDVFARMVREARAMAKVSHRGVIAIHDAGEADGELFLAMELVRGRTLGAILRERSADELRDWRRWLAIGTDAGRGLAAAHAAGVLHRDFKPDNIMVEYAGRVCVGDFGLATLRNADRPSGELRLDREAVQPNLTMAGALLGTPAYMSLEQLRGDAIDARADQFCFCVTVYEAIYGESPFLVPPEEQMNLVALEESRLGAMRPPPVNSQVPAEVRVLLLRGLAPLPADRWPELSVLLDALDAVATPRPVASRSLAWTIGLGAAAVLAVGGVWALLHMGTPPHATSLGPVPLAAVLALSNDGRLAIGTDRVEVRDIASGDAKPVTSDAMWRQILALQFDDERAVRWSMAAHEGVMRWDFALYAPPVLEPATPDSGIWLGSLETGDLLERTGPTNTLVLVRDGRSVGAWALDAGWNQILAVSPSHTRFAYSTGDRFRQQIAVDDGAGHRWMSPAIADLAAVTWLDDQTLLYSSGSSPALMAIEAGSAAPARTIHTLDSGFIGRLAASRAGVVYMRIDPKPQVRLIGRTSLNVRDIDSTYASAELGWTSDGAYVIWNRSTSALERVTLNRHIPYAAKLEHEPVNATIAGDLVIVAERNVGGRELVAISLSTGNVAWRDPIGQSLAARCAADLAPPCYVARRDDEAVDHYAITPFDPRSGRASGTPVYRGVLEDFAVSRDGRRILVATPNRSLVELDDGGARIATYDVEYYVRSVAYDPAGGILLGGTGAASYVVGHYDGKTFTPFNAVTGELLSIVRPSPLTDDVLAQGRTFSASLWRLPRP